MTNHFHIMPVDKTTIKTRLRIHPDLLDDPKAFIDKHDLPIRTMKPTRGRSANGPTRKLALDVLTYKGIKLKLTKFDDDPLASATIDFNPGVGLYGHNGRILSLSQFLDALGLLVTHLKPLLSDPDAWVDLIPGLRRGGVAYWDYIESHLQCADPDGKLFATFQQAVPEKAQIPVRHWPTSMRIGGDKSDRLLTIYRKAHEMVAHGKLDPDRLSDYEHVLRLEMRLKGDKLIDYLGNELNVEVIDRKKRLVRFYPVDLVLGHRACFSGLQGVYSADEPVAEANPNAQLIPLGRLLARVALHPRCSQTYLELVEHLRFYTGASADTMGPIKKAGAQELSRLSNISMDNLFSDAAYQAQHHVASEELEKKVLHEIEDTFVHRLITEAYQPPDQPFHLMTQWPGYLRG